MSVVAFQVDIEADPAHVWCCIADCERLRDWMPEIVGTAHAEADGPADPAAARFVRTMRKGRRLVSYAGVVTAHDPPRRLAMRLAGDREQIDMSIGLCPFGTGTRLDFELITRPATALGALREAMARVWAGRLMRRRLDALKRLAELTPMAAAPIDAKAFSGETFQLAPMTASLMDEPGASEGVDDRDQRAA